MKTIILAAALALVACGKKTEDKPAPTPPPAGSAMGSGSAAGSAAMTGSAAMAGSAAGSDVDVPTEMDFEAAAKSDVTDKTVEAKVKAIEDQLQ